MLRVASIQLNSQNNLDDNLSTINSAICNAKKNGAKLVVLPENACYMGKQADIAHQFHALADFYCHLAKTQKVNLIAGTLPCPYRLDGSLLNGDKFYQTSLAINAHGDIIARYDKIHLFSAIVNDGVGHYDEGKTFVAGDTPTIARFVIDGRLIHVGMMICFDLRFARLAHMLRQMGADILVAPSAFTFQTGQAHWQLLLQARSIDSQCAIIGSAQGGMHQTKNSSRQTWGHSTITTADGSILASSQCTSIPNNHQDNFLAVYADIDLKKQTIIRQNLPIFSCQRLV